jgi:hypothetical protein
MIYYALKRGSNSDKESKTLALFSAMNRTIKLEYFNYPKEVSQNYIPVGTIDWVTSILGYIPIPDYYPNFLRHLLFRNIWKSNKWPIKKGIFVKPYDKPKRFQHIITTGTYKGKKKGPYWCSDLVHFKNEWRYYIVNGKVIYTGWYDGENENIVSPRLNVNIPSYWCGCIDMGILSTGEFALVEAGEPYSIRWYGHLNEGEIYSYFLENGWRYLKNIKPG